jgi:hypothetical protein
MRCINIRAEGYAPEQINYHVKLLADAGFLEATNFTTTTRLDWQPRALTWAGHEFLDTTRNESVWAQVKSKMKDRSLDAPLSVIQQLAVRILAGMLGL